MIKEFIQEYKDTYKNDTVEIEDELLSFLLKEKKRIYNKFPNPSKTLLNKFRRLEKRVYEPIKVAIVGQFSSGKSTFLNALLSHNILPSGITPVTAKISYIKYGDKFRLKVVYKDLKEEYYPLNEIKNFTDQRENVNDISHLVLYAPVSFLKDITFVDTPGLNSTSSSDTKETFSVLEKVDGIIWLTLIDNAGKNSEKETLEKFSSLFGKKSLCVLNQKDKHSYIDINKSLNYMKSEFSKYFEEVVAISARDALQSRSNTIKQQKQDLKYNFIDLLENKVEISNDDYDLYKKQLVTIELFDESINTSLLKSSNINLILDFIDTKIRPHSYETKDVNIKKEISNIEGILTTQVEKFNLIYNELNNIKINYEDSQKKSLETIKNNFNQELNNSYSKLEDIIDIVSLEIFKHIKPISKTYFKPMKNILKLSKYEEIQINILNINEDILLKKLIFDDELASKLFRSYIKTLEHMKNDLELQVHKVILKLDEDISLFINKYQNIEPIHKLESYVEFANMRKFVATSKETLLSPCKNNLDTKVLNISLGFNKIINNISARYENAISLSIFTIKNNIDESFELYKKNPSFGLYEPTQTEIKEYLKRNLNVEMIEHLMCSRRNLLTSLIS